MEQCVHNCTGLDQLVLLLPPYTSRDRTSTALGSSKKRPFEYWARNDTLQVRDNLVHAPLKPSVTALHNKVTLKKTPIYPFAFIPLVASK